MSLWIGHVVFARGSEKDLKGKNLEIGRSVLSLGTQRPE